MFRLLKTLRDRAQVLSRAFHKAEYFTHVGYFGAIILSGHDPLVVGMALLCALVILLILFIGGE